MSGSAPAQVKNWFNDRADKAWTCASCGECKDTTGAEDGTVKDGKRAFDDEVSLGSPERFYGCADLSTVTGIAQASDLPAACPGGWCAEQNCACNGQPSTSAPTVPSTPSPSAAPSTGGNRRVARSGAEWRGDLLFPLGWCAGTSTQGSRRRTLSSICG